MGRFLAMSAALLAAPLATMVFAGCGGDDTGESFVGNGGETHNNQAKALPVEASFTPLGALLGDLYFGSTAFGVSGDGSVVAGNSNAPRPPPYNKTTQAFRWTAPGPMVGLGTLPEPHTIPNPRSEARGISADGAVVVGMSSSASGMQAFRWSEVDGVGVMEGLGDLPGWEFRSWAAGASADGSVIVGVSYSSNGQEAFRWTLVNGVGVMEGLGDLPGGGFHSQARGVSADGTVVVGSSDSGTKPSGYPRHEAFRWTEVGGVGVMEGLGDLTGLGWSSGAMAASADGTVVVGSGESVDQKNEAFRWTLVNGVGVMEGLGDLPGGGFSSYTTAVSADGTVVVGASDSGAPTPYGREAFRWTPADGMRSLAELLVAEGLDLTGWELNEARGVSADGTKIVGIGSNPNGKSEAWLATLPVPVCNGDADCDGLLDGNDDCQDVAEDFDAFEDEDGCPDPDNDGDTIFDRFDQCPNVPEVFDCGDDTDGCPDYCIDMTGSWSIGLFTFVGDPVGICDWVVTQTGTVLEIDSTCTTVGSSDNTSGTIDVNTGDFSAIGTYNLACTSSASLDGQTVVEDSTGDSTSGTWTCADPGGSFFDGTFTGTRVIIDPDNDGDGIPNVDDGCPNQPEDVDGFEDSDGCPDWDNDNDTILDVDDQCPNVPEDLDGFEDADGCPDEDNDNDTILDVDDQCPNQPEDFDGFKDENGCPDPDNDLDGFLDAEDNCPDIWNDPQTDADGNGVGDLCENIADDVTIGEGVIVEEDVTINTGVEVGDNSVIEAGATINKDSSVGEDSLVGAGSVLNRGTSIGNETSIGARSIVGRGAIIGNGVTIGEDVVIESFVIIGDGVTIGDGTVIGKLTVIGADTTIGAYTSMGAYTTIEECDVGGGVACNGEPPGFVLNGSDWAGVVTTPQEIVDAQVACVSEATQQGCSANVAHLICTSPISPDSDCAYCLSEPATSPSACSSCASFVELNMSIVGCPLFTVSECTLTPEPVQIGNGVVIEARQTIECGAVIPDGATVP